jgi:hypothetical protein
MDNSIKPAILLRILLIILFSLMLFTLGCRSNNENKLKGVDIFYYKQIIHYPSEQDCETIGLYKNDSVHLYSKDIVFLKSIENGDILKKIQNLSAKFKDDSSSSFGEPGIHCRLIFENNIEESMCIDWFGNFKIGGKNVGRNDTLCYIIRSNIGFYEFNIVKDEDLILMFPEYGIGEQQKND